MRFCTPPLAPSWDQNLSVTQLPLCTYPKHSRYSVIVTRIAPASHMGLQAGTWGSHFPTDPKHTSQQAQEHQKLRLAARGASPAYVGGRAAVRVRCIF